jgi:hypothetical protein
MIHHFLIVVLKPFYLTVFIEKVNLYMAAEKAHTKLFTIL